MVSFRKFAQFGLVAFAAFLCGASSTAFHSPASLKRAKFGPALASAQARQVADWVMNSADNRGLSFILVDKVEAKVFVFDPSGKIIGATPALLGLGIGDVIPATKGERIVAKLQPWERITPAGRFTADLGEDEDGQTLAWVDYDQSIALHPVMTANTSEHRLERLATPTAADNRISYGCINVPAVFFRNVVLKILKRSNAAVYVLPERMSLKAAFPHYREIPAANA